MNAPFHHLTRVWRRRRAWKYEAQREAFRDALVEHWRECNRKNITEIDRLRQGLWWLAEELNNTADAIGPVPDLAERSLRHHAESARALAADAPSSDKKPSFDELVDWSLQQRDIDVEQLRREAWGS